MHYDPWAPPPPSPPPAARRSPWMRLLIVAAVAGTVAAIAGLALAQTPTPTPTPTPSPSPSPGSQPGKPGPGHFLGKGGPGGPGIHGEFTVPAPNGGYQTIATQAGQVTAVDPSSITLKSEDGYTKTYTVDDNTLVNAGRNGIGSVNTGDQARVMAVVSGDTAHAVDVVDTTNVQRLRDQWRPHR